MNFKWKIAQAAEIRWWKSYLKNKPIDDYLKDKKAYWQRILKQAEIKVKDKDLVLDAGCGPAGVFIILKNNKVDAIDPLIDQYKEQLEHFTPEAYPNVRFVNTALESFSDSKTYDIVFCFNAINHVADLSLSIKKLNTLTKNGGTLILSVDAHNFSFLKKIFRLIPGDLLHPHQYDIEEYEKKLFEAGFGIERKIILKKEFIFNYYLFVAKKQF